MNRILEWHSHWRWRHYPAIVGLGALVGYVTGKIAG